eukprot:UN10202
MFLHNSRYTLSDKRAASNSLHLFRVVRRLLLTMRDTTHFDIRLSQETPKYRLVYFLAYHSSEVSPARFHFPFSIFCWHGARD